MFEGDVWTKEELDQAAIDARALDGLFEHVPNYYLFRVAPDGAGELGRYRAMTLLYVGLFDDTKRVYEKMLRTETEGTLLLLQDIQHTASAQLKGLV